MYFHCFKNDIFHVVIDTQLQQLNDRFTVVNNELLLCMACLGPRKSFFKFNVKRLCEFATFYPVEFNENELLMLEVQLDIYIAHVRSSPDFSNLTGIADLARKMVEKGIDKAYHLVFLLIKLAFTLPVATATVDRAFLAMKIVKTRLCATMSDDWMNDCRSLR